MKQLFSRLLGIIENATTDYSLWLTSFLSLIATRMAIENWLGDFPERSASFFLYEFAHTFLFFLFAYLLFLPLLTFFARVSLKVASNIMLFGFLIILTPPLIDAWISNGKGFWSFYKFDSLAGLWHRFFTLFGDRPDIGITYGVRAEVVIVTLLIGTYTFLKTKHLLRSAIAALLAYTILFILGTFPSYITIILLGFRDGFMHVNDVNIAQMFLSPPLLFSHLNLDVISSLNIKMSFVYALLLLGLILWELKAYFPTILSSLASNLRWPQMIYHGGLLCVGMALAVFFTHTSIALNFFNILAFLTLVLAVEFAWLASVIVNDFFDQKTDILTNPKRPLVTQSIDPETYRAIGWTFFGASLLLSGLVHPKAMFLLAIYQGLAWIYSAWPLRLKRFPVIATGIGAIAGILILLIGFILVSPDGNIHQLPGSLLLFFLLVYTAALPLKDFKDTDGDRADGVYTLPVLLGEFRAKVIIGSALFFSYLLSVFILHERSLFWWALVFGSLSFWILLTSTSSEQGWLRYRLLPAWILGCVTLYGFILVATLF